MRRFYTAAMTSYWRNSSPGIRFFWRFPIVLRLSLLRVLAVVLHGNALIASEVWMALSSETTGIKFPPR